MLPRCPRPQAPARPEEHHLQEYHDDDGGQPDRALPEDGVEQPADGRQIDDLLRYVDLAERACAGE